MRTAASIKNSLFATIMVIVKILIGFVSQKIFVLIMNAEYLGVNGLFSNVITLLSLAELGIGQAIVFNLYRPIANNDKDTIKSLLKLYKKAYNIIAVTVLMLGLLLIPFLDIFVGETSLSLNFTLVYILFLLQSVFSYLMTYKRSILYAYQENYIISVIDSIYLIVMHMAQLLILYLTKNYYLYLIIKITCSLLENMIITYICNKKYSFIKEKNVPKLNKDIEKDIFARIRAEFLHKIGGIVVNGTDNIIISKFLGLLTVGLYSNYAMIISSVGDIGRQMISALMPSVGNLLVEDNKENTFNIYKKVRFFNFWISTFSAVSILVVIQSFINLWMGETYLLSLFVVCVLVINYYLKSMRSANDVFLSGAGICIETKFVPIIESILNIVFSIIGVKLFGLAGVFIGTIISSMALWCYTYPKFLYKNILGGKYYNYIKENIIYFFIFVNISIITYGVSSIFMIQNLVIDIILRCILCVIVPNIIMFIIYRKTDEFIYFKELLLKIIKRKKI